MTFKFALFYAKTDDGIINVASRLRSPCVNTGFKRGSGEIDVCGGKTEKSAGIPVAALHDSRNLEGE
jgi:hypothetical protein